MLKHRQKLLQERAPLITNSTAKFFVREQGLRGVEQESEGDPFENRVDSVGHGLHPNGGGKRNQGAEQRILDEVLARIFPPKAA